MHRCPTHPPQAGSRLPLFAFTALTYLIVMGALIGLSALYQRAQEENKVNDEMTALYQLASNMASYQGLYEAKDAELVAELVVNQDIPAPLRVDSTQKRSVIRNGWGGVVDVVIKDGGEYFVISYHSVPKRACRLFSQYLPEGALKTIGIGFPWQEEKKAAAIGNITRLEAKALCTGTKKGGESVLSIHFSTQAL